MFKVHQLLFFLICFALYMPSKGMETDQSEVTFNSLELMRLAESVGYRPSKKEPFVYEQQDRLSLTFAREPDKTKPLAQSMVCGYLSYMKLSVAEARKRLSTNEVC